jgi:hypothetical protein
MYKWREWRGLDGERTIASARPGTLVDVLYSDEITFERLPAAEVDWAGVRRQPALWRPALD